MGELRFEQLGEKERRLLLKAIDIDWTNLKCQYCGEKVYYTDCCIMPSVNTKELATITCNSPLCVSEYLNDFEDSKNPILEAKKEVFDKCNMNLRQMAKELDYDLIRDNMGYFQSVRFILLHLFCFIIALPFMLYEEYALERLR